MHRKLISMTSVRPCRRCMPFTTTAIRCTPMRMMKPAGSPTALPSEVIRSTPQEREQQIKNLQAFHKRNEDRSAEALKRLKEVVIRNGNLFTELMETVKYCSLGQITHALYEVGG